MTPPSGVLLTAMDEEMRLHDYEAAFRGRTSHRAEVAAVSGRHRLPGTHEREDTLSSVMHTHALTDTQTLTFDILLDLYPFPCSCLFFYLSTCRDSRVSLTLTHASSHSISYTLHRLHSELCNNSSLGL